MPCTHLGNGTILTVGGEYKPGDQPPSSYNDWHEWAEVQYKAGLRQKRCALCSKLKFPQQLSSRTIRSEATDRRGRVHVSIDPVCNECNNQPTPAPPER